MVSESVIIMKTKDCPCEVETPDGRIEGLVCVASNGYVYIIRGEVRVYFPSYDTHVWIPLDDLSDDSRRLVFNSKRKE